MGTNENVADETKVNVRVSEMSGTQWSELVFG